MKKEVVQMLVEFKSGCLEIFAGQTTTAIHWKWVQQTIEMSKDSQSQGYGGVGGLNLIKSL